MQGEERLEAGDGVDSCDLSTRSGLEPAEGIEPPVGDGHVREALLFSRLTFLAIVTDSSRKRRDVISL
jgi:hypothetical protein